MFGFNDPVLVRFLAVGVGNTALGLGTIFLFAQITSSFVANALGYLIVVPISFLTHRDLSFRDRGGRLGAFLRYLPTLVCGYLANLTALYSFLRAGADPYASQAIAISCHVAVTYLMSRHFVFLDHEGTQH